MCVFTSTLHVSFLVVSLHYTLPISPIIPFHVFATFLYISPFPRFPFPFSVCLSFTFCVEVIWSILAFCYYMTCGVGLLIFGNMYVHGLNESHESRFEKRNELGNHE